MPKRSSFVALLLAACLTCAGPATAQPSATPPTARAREWLHRLQTGTIVRAELTAPLSLLLGPQTQRNDVARFGPLGEPLEFVYAGKRTMEDETTVYLYQVRFRSGTYTWWFGLSPQDKVGALLLDRAKS